jgi:hypothetical protein
VQARLAHPSAEEIELSRAPKDFAIRDLGLPALLGPGFDRARQGLPLCPVRWAILL